MTQILEQVARARADSLQSESAALTEDPDGFLVFARENCNFVELLVLIWQVELRRLQQGGVPAKLFLQECDLLVSLIAAPERYLTQIAQAWPQRQLPEELAAPLFDAVQSAQVRLTALAQSVRATRKWLAQPACALVGRDELLRRVRQADEGNAWVPLGDAISRLHSGLPTEEQAVAWSILSAPEVVRGIQSFGFSAPGPEQILERVEQYLAQHGEACAVDRWEQGPDEFFVYTHLFSAGGQLHTLEFIVRDTAAAAGVFNIVWVEHRPGGFLPTV